MLILGDVSNSPKTNSSYFSSFYKRIFIDLLKSLIIILEDLRRYLHRQILESIIMLY